VNLADLVLASARCRPTALAVCAPDVGGGGGGSGTATYAQLDALANRCARALREVGVRRGDRVGVWLDKSVDTVAAMQAVLRLGAAYVPVDAWSPATRASVILNDCAVSALVTTSDRFAGLPPDQSYQPVLQDFASGAYLSLADVDRYAPTALESVPIQPNDLAYILYTSGSTGTPKGVCISHANALAFVDWAVAEVRPTAVDAFSNHAPFHFDLSVFDLYAAFKVGAAVHLVPEKMTWTPDQLRQFIVDHQITIWYSVPSVLALLTDSDTSDERQMTLETPHTVLFAGEPFPTKLLERLRQRVPRARLLNLYGPTETNVCSFFEVTSEAFGSDAAIPIGKACSGDRIWARTSDATEARAGEEGELMVEGASVMLGYWGRPAQGNAPYATGDWVRLLDDGNFVYLRRRDQMLKVRGNRIEPGEVEAALLEHPAVTAAAVLADGTGLNTRLVAFLSCDPAHVPSYLELKRHSAARLPRYMIADEFRILPRLPYTRNGKIDRAALVRSMAQSGA
jgi:amino acid adenylation domain-containing protein